MRCVTKGRRRLPTGLRADVYYLGDDLTLAALVGKEPIHELTMEKRWHVSVSRRDRIPTWDEFREVVETLREKAAFPPDTVFCIPWPPPDHWINIHPHVLHLWEVKDRSLVRMWMLEGEEAQEEAQAEFFQGVRHDG